MKFISFKWPNHNISTYNANIQNLYSYKRKFTVIYWNHGYLFECWFLICIFGIDCVESASGNVDSHDVTRLHISMWNVILIVRTRKLIRNMYTWKEKREREGVVKVNAEVRGICSKDKPIGRECWPHGALSCHTHLSKYNYTSRGYERKWKWFLTFFFSS